MTTPTPDRPTEQTRVRVVPLEWRDTPSLSGRKLTALDCFGNEFARIDYDANRERSNSGRICEIMASHQADYDARVLSCLSPTPAEAPEPTPAKAEAVDTKNATPEVKFLCDLHERFLREYANAGWLSPDYAKGETWGSLAFDILKVAIRLEKLERATQVPAKAEPGEAVSDLEDVVDWVARYGGDCRDCADENGKCPNDGLPCDDRGKPIRFVVEALRYGIANGYVKPFYAHPSADLDRLRESDPHSFGWLYHNPDTGLEWSANHPIESGEVDDAEDVMPATAERLVGVLSEAWERVAEVESRANRLREENERLRRERDEALDLAGKRDTQFTQASAKISRLRDLTNDLRARASRASTMTTREVFVLTDTMMDTIDRAARTEVGDTNG